MTFFLDTHLAYGYLSSKSDFRCMRDLFLKIVKTG
jgi:hypothetical protein